MRATLLGLLRSPHHCTLILREEKSAPLIPQQELPVTECS
jgi:hypothetical protein